MTTGRTGPMTKGGRTMCQQHGPGGIGGPLPGKFAYSQFSEDLELEPRRSLEEVIAMTPEDMACASRLVMGTYNELLQTANSLEDPGYRRRVTAAAATPCSRFSLTTEQSQN